MRSFASDNNSSVHPEIIKAIQDANKDHALGYGEDKWTARATELVKSQFSRECEPYFVFNGTGSNTMALQLMTRPYHTIFCAETAHVAVDECGAPVKAAGCSMRMIHTPDGKLTPELLKPYMNNFGVEHHSQPGAVYISQCTELGTVYTPEELKELTGFAHDFGMKVHIDGARLSNAAVALSSSLEEAAYGADTLTLGGTKNGLMGAECVVVFNKELFEEAKYARKQSCQLASKMRFISCQFIPFLEDGLWRTNAEHANNMTARLYSELKKLPFVQFTQKPQSNQLFLTMPREKEDKLLEKYFFYFWNEEINEVRFVTSFDTTESDIEALIESIKTL